MLQFITAAVVEPDGTHAFVPGIYIMMELAAGGDLFDKIGMVTYESLALRFTKEYIAAPDVGVGDDIAHFFFNQLLSGMVCLPTSTSASFQ